MIKLFNLYNKIFNILLIYHQNIMDIYVYKTNYKSYRHWKIDQPFLKRKKK